MLQVYNAPKFFELKTSFNHELQQHYVDATEMRVDPYYYSIYNIWMNFIFMGLGPFVVLISLNGLTLRSLIFHLKQQNPSSTAYDDRNKSGNITILTQAKANFSELMLSQLNLIKFTTLKVNLTLIFIHLFYLIISRIIRLIHFFIPLISPITIYNFAFSLIYFSGPQYNSNKSQCDVKAALNNQVRCS